MNVTVDQQKALNARVRALALEVRAQGLQHAQCPMRRPTPSLSRSPHDVLSHPV